MKPRLHQRAIKIVMYILGGILALGTLLDSLANALSLLTPLIAGIGTALIVLVWLLTTIILRRHPVTWVVGNQEARLRKLGIQPLGFMVGIIVLLWVPSGLTLFQILPPPPNIIEFHLTWFTMSVYDLATTIPYL